MKRDWNVIEEILLHIEEGDIEKYVKKESFLTDLGIDEDTFFGHVELLIDAKIIKNCSVSRGISGRFQSYCFNGVFITMEGHDLLDAMRNKPFWTKIKAKATSSGLGLSWEFIKAAIPVVIKESIG